MRAIVTSPEESRTNKIIDDLARSFNQYNYAGLSSLKFEQVPHSHIRQFINEFADRLFVTDHGLIHNIMHYNDKMIFNIKELSSIIHFPTFKFNKNPRIAR